MYLSRNLKHLRNKKGVTQDEVGKYLGMNRQEICSYEKGRREPGIKNIINIAKYFDVSIDELLTKDMNSMGSVLGENLKFLRNSIHANKDEMAQIIKVSKSTYSKYENGMVEPNIEGLISVSEFFGVTVNDLLKRDLSKGVK